MTSTHATHTSTAMSRKNESHLLSSAIGQELTRSSAIGKQWATAVALLAV